MKDSIGSLWRKTAKSGVEYFSGTFKQTNGQELSIVIFSNDKGGVEKRPDYRIYLSEPRGEGAPF